jgi:hypothetical protein
MYLSPRGPWRYLDDINKYVNQAKYLPKTATCSNVMALCSDPFAVAKMTFIGSVSAVLEPFF